MQPEAIIVVVGSSLLPAENYYGYDCQNADENNRCGKQPDGYTHPAAWLVMMGWHQQVPAFSALPFSALK